MEILNKKPIKPEQKALEYWFVSSSLKHFLHIRCHKNTIGIYLLHLYQNCE